MGLMQHPIDHETLPTCCHVRSHVDVSSVQICLVSHAFKVNVKWTWTVPDISTNPIIGISWVKGPSSSSVMWPFNIQAQIVFPLTHPTCKAWAWAKLCDVAATPSMIGENRQLFTKEPVEFEKQPVEVQDCMKLTDHFRGIYRIYLNSIKENRRMSTCS